MRPPERIGRHRVQSVIGVGGFAVVFRAYDDVLDDAVAIKVLAENWVQDPDIRERFLEEARLLRRIRNDHLLTVHDVGELEGGQPYFVMEFAKRGTLADRLATRGSIGLDPASARKLADALADGMGALHRAGIVHRDVNPRNLFLQADDAKGRDERAGRATQLHRGLIAGDEQVLLGDLGLAKDVVRTGGAASVIGGTPHYNAPEQLDPFAPVRPAADIFAATGVLWEAITGTPPPHPTDLDSVLVAVDERWHPLFRRGLAADPDERFDGMDVWREAVLAAVGPATAGGKSSAVTQPTALATTGPYKGLAAFQPEDATRFFGRDVLVAELLERLGRARTLVVGGPSGSGKSSLVRAGLIPAVAAGGLPGSEGWPVALLTPRFDPVGELAYQLTKTARSVTQQPAPMDSHDESLRDVLRARYVAESITDIAGGLLLVIDQFEELFTQSSGRPEQQAFLDLLAGIVDPTDSRVRLVIAMRADFYSTSALFPWLAHRISENQVLVGPMTRRELRQAIEEPARQAGLGLEDELVDAVLEDGGSEPGALPLVSHALAETWRRRSGTTLTVAGYREAGGVAGALAQTAEALYQDRFDDAQRRATRRLLLRLISPGAGTPDTRRPLPLSELESDGEPEVIAAVAREMTDARLLTVDRDTIDIAHEALISRWPRLRAWIEESRDDLRVRQRLDRAGAEWAAQGRDPDLLYRGTPLQSALEWAADHGDELSPAGRELIQASETAWIEAEERREQAAQRSRRIRRAAVTVLSVLTIVALGASVVAFRALGQARERLAQSLATQAVGLVDEDPRLALALAVEAIARGARSLEARLALVEGNSALAATSFAPTGSEMNVGDALSLALRPDGEIVATGNRNGTVRVWATASGQELGPALEGHAGAVQALAFTPDGRWLVTVGDDGTVRRWDLDDPAAVPAAHVLGSFDGIIWAVAVSPDGTTAASVSTDGTVRLWDLEGGGQLGAPLAAANHSFDRVAFSPDGALLLASNARGEILGWRLSDGDQVVGPIEAHDGPVWGLAFDPTGELLATAGAEGHLRLWEVATGRLVAEPFEDVRGPQISPDGSLLLAGDAGGRVRAWSLTEQEELPSTEAGHDARILGTALSGAGDILATLGFDHTVRMWSQTQHTLGLVLEGHDEGAFGVAVSADGDLVATGDGTGAIRVFSMDDGEPVRGPLPGHDSAVWALDFSSDGNTLASGGADGTVLLHDLRTGDVTVRVDGHDDGVSVVRFEGDRLLTGGGDGVVRFWDSDGRVAGEPLGPHRGAVTDMAWGPDRTLAVTDRGGNVRLWRPQDGASVSSSIPPHDNTLWSVAWSRDRAMLAVASADEMVDLWNMGRSERTASLTPHPGGATGVSFLADGVTVATTSANGSVRLWDVALGRSVGAPLTAHDDTVWRLAAHPDDDRFATSSTDGTVRIWDILHLERACERAEGAFDEEQRRRYLGEGEAAMGCR